MASQLIPTQRSDQYSFAHLQVILKTVERCNLACDYCYYFFGGDESYRDRPAVIGTEEPANIRDFLVEGCMDLNIPKVSIIFHGGEPMLQKPRHFDRMCRIFREMNEMVATSLGMQTNGTIISAAWIDLRRTVTGKGSYDTIVGNLEQFRTCADDGEIGTISVVSLEVEYGTTMKHYAENLGIRKMSFLLPDCSHDDGIPDGHSAEEYGRQLCKIFDGAIATGMDVREVTRILDHFQEKVPSEKAMQRSANLEMTGKRHRANQIVVIHSDGTLDIDDSYIPAQTWRGRFPTPHVRDTTLRAYLNSPQFSTVDEAFDNVPDACKSCEWLAICGGGDLENRWEEGRGFNNPSVYCDGLKIYYAHVIQYLYRNGYPKEKLLRALKLA